jgi:hypothetical protein
MILFLSILIAVGVAWLLFSLFFDEDLAELLGNLRLAFTPDLITALRGEWGEAGWAALKVWGFLLLSIGSGAVAYHLLERALG